MALVKCKECGAEISDKAESCPKCGCPVQSQTGDEHVQKVEVVKKKKSKKKPVLGIIIVLIILAAIAYTGYTKISKAKASLYYGRLLNITDLVLDGAVKAESVANLTRDVWYNTIFQKGDPTTDKFTKKNGRFYDDFNDALNELFTDSDFMSDIDYIEDNQSEVKALMKQMKNPPKEYEDAYEDLSELYDTYLDFTNLAINPSGNYTSFSDNFVNLDSEIIKQYNRVKDYLE